MKGPNALIATVSSPVAAPRPFGLLQPRCGRRGRPGRRPSSGTVRASTAIASIDPAAWTAIRYPDAVWGQDEQRLINDAEIAEVEFTPFTSRRKCDPVTNG